MKNIKTETNWVRVMGNTGNAGDAPRDEMIGQECEVHQSDYKDNTICVWDKSELGYHWFNKSDVRFLTPAKFKEKHIAIDDEVFVDGEWRKVLGFYMYDNQIKLLTGTLDETVGAWQTEIKRHRTEPVPETKMTIAQIEEKLNITGLKIIE